MPERSKQLPTMSQLSLNKFSENLPVSGTIGLTQAATGVGLGLLIATSSPVQRVAAPAVCCSWPCPRPGSRDCQRDHARPQSPGSSSRARRHLESIREDIGFHDTEGLI